MANSLKVVISGALSLIRSKEYQLLIRSTFAAACYLLACCLVPAEASSANQQIITVAKTELAISVDGKLDEAAWQQATVVELDIVTRPFDNTPSPVKTQALLIEDGASLYIGFIAHDPNPERIRAFLKDRDKSWGDDIVGVKLDTYNNQNLAYRFLSNPLGVQIDGIENELTGNESDAWDGIWDSKGHINDQGYVVEMALPFRMLNFRESDQPQDWGIELLRRYPREQNLRISNIRLDRGNKCELCQLATARGFANAKQGQNLIVTPSLVIARDETREQDQPWQSDNEFEPSLDVRWGITPDILFNATLNPDFSTVETDQAQLSINNTFTLFVKEKRPFFLDNADYFSTDYNLVYTRNIYAPNYGGKITGRHNNHSFGLFVADDETTNILIPGNRGSSVAELDDESTNAALRYNYDYTQDITLGWISTLRQADDYRNQVHGIDGRIRFNDTDVFQLQKLYSRTEYPDDLYQQFCDTDDGVDCQPQQVEDCDLSGCDINEQVLRTDKEQTFSGHALRTSFIHDGRDWFYKLGFEQQNSGFRGDLGFIGKVDYQRKQVAGARYWYNDSDGAWWQKFRIYSDWDITHNDDGELIEKEFDVSARLDANYESEIYLAYTRRDLVGKRIDQSSLDIDGNTTLFNMDIFQLFTDVKPFAGLYLSAKLEYGDAIDFASNRLGTKRLLRTVIDWSPNQHLQLKLRQTYRDLDADGANVFIARLTDFRATYQFNVQSFLRGSLIYKNNARNPNNYLYDDPEDIDAHSRDFSFEFLYAYKINPQTVFYAGYSEYQDTNEEFSDLEANDRRAFVKFSYAWIR
ncbi:carbohydrate binding family 9 domain-containing protein [Neiella sp. HB171785]|uniref:Carbohydrate binding family 9 domain-containing protein n=1 Tax=Neiella litorisoli TaxID=2771431 RepID=A0A8J6QQ69_9GAMM|nr:carbohydrate binding family 9 domain-containing protein [Neiella litorisoli]MBD1388489.1 carbohydrate binding family 9 domain-containing protein [Neiella litorisoli]